MCMMYAGLDGKVNVNLCEITRNVKSCYGHRNYVMEHPYRMYVVVCIEQSSRS